MILADCARTGPLAMASKNALPMLYCWMVWSFILVAYTLTAVAAADIYRTHLGRQAKSAQPDSQATCQLPGLTGITMTQEVQLVREELDAEKVDSSNTQHRLLSEGFLSTK